jgi:hypothetical protein
MVEEGSDEVRPVEVRPVEVRPVEVAVEARDQRRDVSKDVVADPPRPAPHIGRQY